MERSVSEFEKIMHNRASASLPEMIVLLADMHDVGVRIPLEYYRCSIDICAHQCDIRSMEVLLSLARKNISRDSPSSLPFNTLLGFALSKFSRYGYSAESFQIWQSFLREGDASQKDLLLSITHKMFTQTSKNSIDVFRSLMERVALNVWDENYQHCTNTFSTMREYAQRWYPRLHPSEVDPPPPPRVDAVLATHLDNTIQSIPRNGPDVMALRLQHPLAMSLPPRRPTDLDSPSLAERDLYEVNKRDFMSMLNLLRAHKGGGAIGGVDPEGRVSDHQIAAPRPCGVEATLLRIVGRELQVATLRGHGKSPPYQGLLRMHRGMLEHRPPHGGADAGANYEMNSGRENVRMSLLLFLEDMSRREPLQNILPMMNDILSAYTCRYLSRPSSGEGGGASMLQCSSYDDAIAPLRAVHMADTKSPFSPLRESHNKRSVPLSRASEQLFLQLVINTVMKNYKYSSTRADCLHVSDDSYGWSLYAEVGQFAWDLQSLAASHGIRVNSDFYAFWIMSLPLMVSTSQETGWQKSLKHIMRIKRTLVEQGRLMEHDSAVSNAIVSHLCQYKTADAVNYATHIIREDMSNGVAIPTETWNVLLSGCLSVGSRRTVRVVLGTVLEKCSSLVRTENLSVEDEFLKNPHSDWAGDRLSQVLFSNSVAIRQEGHDVGLSRAVFRAHMFLGRGFEAFRSMKLLRASGAVISRNEYTNFIKCITRSVSNTDPLTLHMCSNPKLLATYLLQEMKKDGALDSSSILDLLDLFLYSTTLNRRNNISRHSNAMLLRDALDAKSFCVKNSTKNGIALSNEIVVKLMDIFCLSNLHEQALQMAVDMCSTYDLPTNSEMFLQIQKYCILFSNDTTQMDRILDALLKHHIALPPSLVNDLLHRWCEDGNDKDMEKLWHLYRTIQVEPEQQNLLDGVQYLLDNGRESEATQLAEYMIFISPPDDKRLVQKQLKVLFKHSGFESNF